MKGQKMKTRYVALSLVALSACEPTTLFDSRNIVMEPPVSGNSVPNSNGTITTTLTDTIVGNEVDGTNGFGYVAGLNSDRPRAEGYAGLLNTTNLATPPLTGNATMTGAYRIARLDGLTLGADNKPTGQRIAEADQITLTADFANKTLTGTANALSVNGTFDGNTLTGAVTFDGLDGSLRGQVGPDSAIGAFDGADADTVYSGGFYVRD